MPRIPVFTAEGSQAVYQAPHVPQLPSGGGLSPVGESLGQLGHGLQDIADRIQRTRQDLDLSEANSLNDAKMKILQQEVLVDPSAPDKTSAFVDRARKAQTAILDTIQDPFVRQAFTKHVTQQFLGHVATMKVEELKWKTNQTLADLESAAVRLSSEAGSTDNPAVMDAKQAEFRGLAKRALDERALHPLDYQKMLDGFKEKTLEKNMKFWAIKDPDQLTRLDQMGAFNSVDPLRRGQILEESRKAVEAAQARALTNENRINQGYDEWAKGQAEQGLFPQSEIDQAIMGKHPILRVEQGRALQATSDNPTLDMGGVKQGVLRIMGPYLGAGERTLPLIERTRAELNAFQAGLGRDHPLINEARRTLQTDIDAVKGADTRERATRAAELQAGIQSAVDLLKGQRDPIPPFLKSMFPNMSQQEEAQVRTLMRLNPKRTPASAVDEVMAGRKGKGAAVTPAQERIQNAIQDAMRP